MAYFEELKEPLICEGCGRRLYAKGMWNKLRAAKNCRPGPRSVRISSYISHVGLCCNACGRDWDVQVLFVDRFEGAFGRAVPKDGYQIRRGETAQGLFERILARRGSTKESARSRDAASRGIDNPPGTAVPPPLWQRGQEQEHGSTARENPTAEKNVEQMKLF